MLAVFLTILPFCAAGLQAQETTAEANAAASLEIATQELRLKEMQLELDKAKLEQRLTAEQEQRKNELTLEIMKLELLKARRDLQVQESNERLDMLVHGDVLFDTNSDSIKPGAEFQLRQVGLLLGEYPTGNVTVVGFADSSGNEQNNMELSRRRGEAVKNFLLIHSGGKISSERIVASGRGQNEPVASNLDSAGRQLNRRVEISIVKRMAE